MSEQIDFNDTSLVEFQRVKSPDELGGFTSDVDEFNDYVGPEMAFDLEHSITQVYMIRIGGHVAGYVDLAMAHLRNNATPAILAKRIETNVPALLISRLSVDVVFQGHDVGRALLDLVIDKLVPKLKKIAGCRYVMLNPRDDQGVRDFYEHYGFDYIKKLKDGGEPDKESDAFLFDLTDIPEEADE